MSLLQSRCISVVGSRQLHSLGAAFAAQAGRLAAQEGYTLCSGDAMGADRTAQEACLQNGGSALVFRRRAGLLPGAPTFCMPRRRLLELGFSAQRALSRNRLIHAMGEKTLVAQTSCGKGGTWSGSLDNLQHEYSPLFVFDDGSDGAAALCTRRNTGTQGWIAFKA